MSEPDPTEDFSRLLVAERRRIYGFIYALVQDRAHADDVFQDVSVVLWRKFETFEPGSDFAAWAMCVARFTVLNWRRKQEKQPLNLSDQALHDMADHAVAILSTPDRERHEALRSCLDRLTGRQRELVRRRFELEVPVTTIAEEENRTPRSIYLRLEKIYGLLLSCLRTQRDPRWNPSSQPS